MLDIGRQEISLQAKRRDLIAKIAEGRAVIATLMERHAAMGRKIEEATSGLRRLEDQLAAMNTVMKVFDEEGLIMTAETPVNHAAFAQATPLRAVAVDGEPTPCRPATRRKESFKPLEYVRCLSEGHLFVVSRAAPGYTTCDRCRVRRRI